MKKFATACLCFCLGLLVLAACGKKDEYASYRTATADVYTDAKQFMDELETVTLETDNAQLDQLYLRLTDISNLADQVVLPENSGANSYLYTSFSAARKAIQSVKAHALGIEVEAIGAQLKAELGAYVNLVEAADIDLMIKEAGLKLGSAEKITDMSSDDITLLVDFIYDARPLIADAPANIKSMLEVKVTEVQNFLEKAQQYLFAYEEYGDLARAVEDFKSEAIADFNDWVELVGHK